MVKRIGCLATVYVGLFAACSHASTYGYQSTFDKQFFGNEDPEPPPVEARQLLASARTVAFYPPDTCLNATPTESQQDKVLRARCGVLLSKPVSYTHLRAHETPEHLVCRLLLEKKKK